MSHIWIVSLSLSRSLSLSLAGVAARPPGNMTNNRVWKTHVSGVSDQPMRTRRSLSLCERSAVPVCHARWLPLSDCLEVGPNRLERCSDMLQLQLNTVALGIVLPRGRLRACNGPLSLLNATPRLPAASEAAKIHQTLLNLRAVLFLPAMFDSTRTLLSVRFVLVGATTWHVWLTGNSWMSVDAVSDVTSMRGKKGLESVCCLIQMFSVPI